MDYIQLTKLDGVRVLLPTNNIVYIQENMNSSTVYTGLATVHVVECYQDIVQMIDDLP